MLTLRSDAAKPVLTIGLLERGHDVTQIVAYRTVGVPSSIHIREDVSEGRINAILVPSPQVAKEVAKQFVSRPKNTVIACLSDKAHEAALELGLIDANASTTKDQASMLASTVLNALDPADMVD